MDEEELLLTLPLDVETLPDDVDTLPDEVETLPEEVETPPVEVDTPPVDVDTPPVVELVELVMPPVELLVEEMTTEPPLDPPLPPKNPPKKPPPPKPGPPASTTGAPPLPPDRTGISAGSAGGRGMGAAWVVTVTVCGAQEVTVLTTRRFSGGIGLRGAAFTLLVLWTTAGRALSATWTAPPPTIAPPAAQAHNLAIAIRTDIRSHSCLSCGFASTSLNRHSNGCRVVAYVQKRKIKR